jgi:putative hemolysin
MMSKPSSIYQIHEPLAFTAGPPLISINEGAYIARMAQKREELDAALKLRFEVFNLELEEGLESSYQTGRDIDEFDAVCHHLLIIEAETDAVVGTYRLQTSEIASRGFYSAGEFDLSYLPEEVLRQSVELGRACIAPKHRRPHVLFLLWKGLAAYLLLMQKRYMFGCCSLTSQDADEGRAVMRLLEEGGHFHKELYVPPQPGFECFPIGFVEKHSVQAKIPKLFRTYLRYGAKVCGEPAIDRAFKTIDFFVLFDLAALDLLSRDFFGL